MTVKEMLEKIERDYPKGTKFQPIGFNGEPQGNICVSSGQIRHYNHWGANSYEAWLADQEGIICAEGGHWAEIVEEKSSPKLSTKGELIAEGEKRYPKGTVFTAMSSYNGHSIPNEVSTGKFQFHKDDEMWCSRSGLCYKQGQWAEVTESVPSDDVKAWEKSFEELSTKDKIAFLKKKYPKGTRLIPVHMNGEFYPSSRAQISTGNVRCEERQTHFWSEGQSGFLYAEGKFAEIISGTTQSKEFIEPKIEREPSKSLREIDIAVVSLKKRDKKRRFTI